MPFNLSIIASMLIYGLRQLKTNGTYQFFGLKKLISKTGIMYWINRFTVKKKELLIEKPFSAQLTLNF
jgi:hypothetical protein